PRAVTVGDFNSDGKPDLASANYNNYTVSVLLNRSVFGVTGSGDTYFVREGETLNVSAPGVLANDVDVHDDALTAVILSNPSHGTVELNPDGSFSYIPDSGYVGSDLFTYTVSDGNGDTDVATVSIEVMPPDVCLYPTFAARYYPLVENGEAAALAVGDFN